MKFLPIQQNSPEWWDLKVGKISGTRFGQLISTRENMLIEELANEIMDGYIEPEEYVSEDMQFGIDNEPIALDKLESILNVKFIRGGVIQSDFHENHIASPDAHFVNERGNITVIEVKCTRDGKKHLKRFREGAESCYRGQILNYLACSDDIDEVIWASYCPFRPEREIVYISYTRESSVLSNRKPVSFGDMVEVGRALLAETMVNVNELINAFKF